MIRLFACGVVAVVGIVVGIGIVIGWKRGMEPCHVEYAWVVEGLLWYSSRRKSEQSSRI